MIMQFKTARNVNGHRKYIAVDTDNRTYTRLDPRMITEGIEIKSRDYDELRKQLEKDGFREVDNLTA